MELFFKTSNPSDLYSSIINMIEKEELKTWTIHEENKIKYLKHTQQWGEKGVIQIKSDIMNSQLKVEVLRFDGIKEDVKDFEGYYLGRFCEIVFVNFPNKFQSINKG